MKRRTILKTDEDAKQKNLGVQKTGCVRLGSKLSETFVKELTDAADVGRNRTINYINFRNAVDFISKQIGWPRIFFGFSLFFIRLPSQTFLFEPTSKIPEAVMNYA
ncbi:hypothetical protein Tco_1120786 [Tanacetum coccineum]